MLATVALPTRIDLASPLVSPGADDLVSRWDSRGLIRDLAAETLDENLRFLARADVLIRRAIGQGLARLVQGHHLVELSYASLGDYAAQRTGYSPRHAQELGVRPNGGAHMVVVGARIVSEAEVPPLPREAMPMH